MTAETVYGRSKSITEGRDVEKFAVAVNYNLISRIDQVRYAQILNVAESVGRRYAYLWGTGYGGYYEDRAAPFPIELKSSFAQYSLEEGRYFRTHSFTTHMFVKYGVLGMFFLYGMWFIPTRRVWVIWKRSDMFAGDDAMIRNSILLALAAFVPTAMFQTYWSVKGLLINGLVIALLTEFASRHPSGGRGAG
jgi:hypothetical protein